MKIITDLKEMSSLGRSWSSNTQVGFVPTMGYLHEGHLSLVTRSNQQCDITIVSIFVNPAQFGPQEDLSVYPRDLERDLELLRNYKVNYVFFPNEKQMYPDEFKTWVEVDKISSILCGASRVGHFKGVATIIAKLVNIVNPHHMFMGEKDFQQCLVLETMLNDLDFHTRIVRCPIIREQDGLAMSSRNKYLSNEERSSALCLYLSLQMAQEMWSNGITDTNNVEHKMKELIKSMGGRIDYIAFVNSSSLQTVKQIDSSVRLLLAVFIGKTRLIDNCGF